LCFHEHFLYFFWIRWHSSFAGGSKYSIEVTCALFSGRGTSFSTMGDVLGVERRKIGGGLQKGGLFREKERR
jgi:hypothetical protein